MDKLFKYSKIVSCIALLTTIICATTFNSNNTIIYTYRFASIIALYLSISIWYGFIAIKSVAGSNLKTLSVLGCVFTFTIVIAEILLRNNVFTTLLMSTFLYISSIGGIGLGFVFTRLSIFFNKRLIKTLAIVLGVLLLLNNLGFTLILSFDITLKINLVFLINIIIWGLYSAFFFFFSKYNK